MSEKLKNKPSIRVRVGLYTTGLKAYWPQFEGLKRRLENYGSFIATKLETIESAEVFNFGLVDSSEKGIEAGEYFQRNLCDIVLQHIGTYVTSDAVLPVHQICKAPTVILNLQPSVQVNYAKTTTGEWLAHCNACPAPEIANAFNRAGIKFRVVSGLLGLNETPAESMADESTSERPEAVRAWREIRDWVRAASVKVALSRARFGFLGNNYSGMLDMYSDFTMLQGSTGMHVELIEMCDLAKCLGEVKDEDVARKLEEIKSMFEISEDSPSDPLARRPSPEQLDWSARIAAAQEKMVSAFNLDALAYYYHGADGNEYEQIQSGFIVGHSLLTANGIPCAGEGDLKTALAMKISDLLGVGGSFCEIVTTDYLRGTILMGHDGPFHLAIAKGKPILRGLGLYHGKRGSGVSVEAKVKSGAVTTLGVTQTGEGKIKFIVSEAEATDDPIMAIGNTQTHVRLNTDPDTWYEKWLMEAPTHHFAMSVGHNAALLRKVADILGVEIVQI